MSNKSFFAKREEHFSSALALFKHLGQLHHLQFDSITKASDQHYKAILRPLHEGHLRQPNAADYWEYWVDFGQRSLLYWDALRQRGDNTLAYERAGYPLLLKFPYEVLIDGRDLSSPVNYSLLKITPAPNQPTNEEYAPVIIIDPRAGPGAGIGGFKQASTVGESLRAGRPTYFIAFSYAPEPSQTLHDINVAHAHFIEEVIHRHPDTDKPIVIGNCQAGWALMGLAASRPELPGLVIINGAPLSARESVDEHNPMRYAGGLLGGAWTTRLASDLGSGRFDGAWLVSYFESLNPANTHWNKYYNLFSKVDSEVSSFLDFERWWGNPTLLNSEEIEAIIDDLFIGNRLAGGLGRHSSEIDLKKIEAPVVVFCSYGDVIAPPQQALNWIADIYPSDLALRNAGRTIVYLKHASIDHLDIFVSGDVARREHRELLAASEAIALLAPGLYEMTIDDVPSTSESEHSYEVHFESRQIADILGDNEDARKRDSEREFAMVDQISQINNALYESYIRPWLRAAINEPFAELMRKTHPLRMRQYAYSSLNPAFSWLASSAPVVRANRQSASLSNPLLVWQETFSNLIEAQLDNYRAIRDTSQEINFHAIYGGLSALTSVQTADAQQNDIQQQDEDLTEHLRESLSQGGGTEALVRILFLLSQKSGKFSKDRVDLLAEQSRHLIKKHDIDVDSIDDIIDLQGQLAFALPVESLETLPLLLISDAKRKELLDNIAHLVPELLTTDGAVGELWHQLLQLFEQPESALTQPKLAAAPSNAGDRPATELSASAEKKTTQATIAAEKTTDSAKTKAHPTAAKQQDLPITAPQIDDSAFSDEKRVTEVKTAVRKPAKFKARKTVTKQQKRAEITPQTSKGDQKK